MDGFCSLNTFGQGASQFCRRGYVAVDSGAGNTPYACMRDLVVGQLSVAHERRCQGRRWHIQLFCTGARRHAKLSNLRGK